MLVIFDCDGVLVDSESLAAEVFSEQLQAFGISMSAQQCLLQFHGHTLNNCFAWLEKEFATSLPESFSQALAHATKERFCSDLKPVEGVIELLEALNGKEVEYCVASNGEHKKIDHSLELTGLSGYFPSSAKNQRRFSMEDVAVGKPSPELFLYAAESIGVPPRFCSVVEDSASGFAAAKAAEMNLIRYLPGQMDQGGHRSAENSKSKDITVRSMLEVRDRIDA